jgi:hypothetical protein
MARLRKSTDSAPSHKTESIRSESDSSCVFKNKRRLHLFLTDIAGPGATSLGNATIRHNTCGAEAGNSADITTSLVDNVQIASVINTCVALP